MSAYLIIKNINVENANALQCEYIIGTPSLTQWNGFIDKIERDLSNKTPTKFSGFAVSYHHYELINAFGAKYSCKQFTNKGKPMVIKNGSVVNASLAEEPLINFKASIVIKCDFDEEEDLVKEAIYNAIVSNKICGGFFKEFDSKNPIQFIYNNDELHDNDRKILNRLYPGSVLINREDLIKRDISDNSLTPLEDLMNYVTNEHKDNAPLKKEGGWFVPVSIGFKQLSDLKKVSNQRFDTPNHCFCESIVTLGEYKSPLAFHNIDDILWKREYDPINKHYILINNKQQEAF